MTQPFSRRRFLVNSILLLTPVRGFTQGLSTTKRWPFIHKPSGKAKIITVQKGTGDKPFIYHTRHFELRSPKALSRRHLEKFATTAESVPRVLAKFPVPLLGMPEGGRAKIFIYPDEDSFVAAGGAIGAAGYYSGRKKAIMLRADSFLQPSPPAGSRLPPKADYDLLVHEFTHLCMHRDLAYLPTWFSEGVAEYLAAAHENNGLYRFDKIKSAIPKRIKQNLPNDKEHVRLPGIVETMQLTPKDWRTRVELSEEGDAYRMYGTSLLLVHTLLDGGSKRRKATKTFLQNLRPYKKLNQNVESLIPSSSREQLQQNIVNFWKPLGLRIKFFPNLEK